MDEQGSYGVKKGNDFPYDNADHSERSIILVSDTDIGCQKV